MAGAGGYKPPKGYDVGKIQNYTPQQMQLFQSLFSQVSPDSYTARLAGGDQALFNEMEQPAMRQFEGLQGNIASRFSMGGGGPGAMSGRRSSGFQNSMNSATSEFAQSLQARRQELQRQAIKDLMGMSTDLLGQRPEEQFLVKNRDKSFLQKLMGGALPIAGAGLGAVLGGPAGLALGSTLGSMAGNAFSGGDQQQYDFASMSNLPTNWNQYQSLGSAGVR